MVTEVFSSNFDAGLKLYNQHRPNSHFTIQGEVFSDEIVLAVSLMSEGEIAATTVYASCDFDPKASTPTVQDLLSVCVDAAGGVFSSLLSPDSPEIIEQVADESLSALENVPFQWTEIEADKKRIFVKIDKSNLALDTMADAWLKTHDPGFEERTKKEQEETENLFFTGPKKKIH
jgi:hypothetical protein